VILFGVLVENPLFSPILVHALPAGAPDVARTLNQGKTPGFVPLVFAH
jgi:hypothetical protein